MVRGTDRVASHALAAAIALAQLGCGSSVADAPPRTTAPASGSLSELAGARVEVLACTIDPIDEARLRSFLARAREISADVHDGWAYAPWCTATLHTPEGAATLQLFLGGRGRLARDGRSPVRFEFVVADP
ncbi:MAG: hypothetical protein K1X94_06800 [Sandaracinaceae bacterium]|nr:hypothetical protein [Sandaracinaceae bacterium]